MPCSSAVRIARVQPAQLAAVEALRRPQRMDARAPERLVDVDVPEPGERALVEERRLDRRAPLRRRSPSRAAVKSASSGSSPSRVARYGVELARLEQEPGAEAADVAVGDVRSVV